MSQDLLETRINARIRAEAFEQRPCCIMVDNAVLKSRVGRMLAVDVKTFISKRVAHARC